MSVLVFAGVDPSGRAGLTRDLWTLERAGVPALGVPSCLTIQSGDALRAESCDPNWILDTLEALRSAHEIRVVKTGLVLDAATWGAALPALRALKDEGCAIVVDPCRGPSRGGLQADDDVRDFVCESLTELGAILTPNRPELAWICEHMPSTADRDDAERCRELLACGFEAIVLKGGHASREEELSDFFFGPEGERRFVRVRREGERRGTGCVYASFLAAGLWSGLSTSDAARVAGHQLGQCWELLASP